MRDFRDAKAMAQTLRQTLATKALAISHSESLEMISRLFGLDNWNILAAKIEAERPQQIEGMPLKPEPKAADPAGTLYCSFCGKSQHDVAKLIAGPTVFICNECVGLCDVILEDENDLGGLIRAEQSGASSLATLLAAKTSDELSSIAKSAARIKDRSGMNLQIARAILSQPNGGSAPADALTTQERALDAVLRARPPQSLQAFADSAAERVANAERVLGEIERLLAQRGN